MKFEWEVISSNKHGHYQTYRAKVIGGWLVRYCEFSRDTQDNFAMVFIQDKNHSWVVEVEKQ